jgi:ribosome-binding factor A
MDDTLDTRLITVPEVRVSPDLKWATIFVRYLKPEPNQDWLEALDKHRKFVRHEVTKRVNLKFSPDIRFREDDRMDAADRIDALLRSENVARDLK